MSGTVDLGPVTLSVLDQMALVGSAIATAGLVLPWVSTTGVTGLTYGPISPVLVAATAVASLAALLDRWERERTAALSLAGVTLAAWSTILFLGIGPPVVGLGIYVTGLGGLVMTSVGYRGLRAETSWLAASVVICVGSLAVNTALIVALGS